jgi:hypothetical protein
VTTTINTIAHKYLQLALAIEQHMHGYCDAYFGPAEWKDEAEARGQRPLVELLQESQDLAQAVDGVENVDSQRRDSLTRQIRAMQTSLRILQGEQMPLAEEVQALYDITPEWVDESTFASAHTALDRLLPPGGSLPERMQANRKATEVPLDRAILILPRVMEELRRRTRALFPLPPGESFELQFVSDQPWGAYNWYLGDFRSRIDVNTDLPWQVTTFAPLMAHEGYPGHHTEHAIKEALLAQEQGHVEQSVVLLAAPQSLVSEGIANRGLSVLMSDEEQIAWNAEEIFPSAGLGHLDARRQHEIVKAHRKLAGVSGNAAFLLHDRDASKDQVIAYLQQHSLGSADRAEKGFQFISNPLFRSYVFNYRYGEEMVEALLAARGDAAHWFARLLSEPVTPSQIRDWTVGRAQV